MFSYITERLPSSNRTERIWKLAQVDFQSRYYNDKLGLLWALIKPVFEAALYYIAFKYLLGTAVPNFGLFLFSGIITWVAFAEGTSSGISLLQRKIYLIDNIQFNHIDLYLSHTFSIMMGYFFNLFAFICICLFLGQSISWTIFILPILILNIYILIFAFSQILSTIQPFFKDLTHLWDMLVLTGFWISGIFFDPIVITEKAPWVAFLNPFIGIITNIRGIFIDTCNIDYYWMVHNLIFSVVILIIAQVIFKKYSALAIEKI